MATSAFKSTTRRTPIGANSSPSTEDSPDSSSSKAHRRSRSLSIFSRSIPLETESDVIPTPRRKFVNTVRGSEFPEISLDDLAIEFFYNSSELEDESVSSRSIRPVRVKSEMTPAPSRRRSVSVSRHPSGDNSVVSCSGGANVSTQRRGRSVSRRNDGNDIASNGDGTIWVVPNTDFRRRRSVSVARRQISDTESDIDLSRSSASQPKSRNMNGNNRVASFQRPTVSSHRRLTRSMSQAPQLRSHDDYSSHSSALTDDELRDACYGKNGIEKTIRAVYAQKKIDHPTGDDANHGFREAMRKELRSAVNEIMIELEQTKERKPSGLSVHDRLSAKKIDATRKSHTKLKQVEKHKQDLSEETALVEQRVQDGFKIVREVLPESKNNANGPKVSYSRKRSNDRNRMSKQLYEEAEKYFEDFISNIEDTDFSSFDGERSDTSSSLVGTTAKQSNRALPTQNVNIISLPVEMEGINLPWLEWNENDGVSPTTPKTKLWDPSRDLKMIQYHGNQSGSSHGSWNPERTTVNSLNAKGNRIEEETPKSPRFDMGKYFDLQRTEELFLDSWRERSVIRSGGLLLCSIITPF
ncbi:hypothetical protein R6Q57_002046 [Mikania cordata]